MGFAIAEGLGGNMFVLRNLLIDTANVLDILLKSFEAVILIRVVLSWANASAYNNFVRVIYALSEPFLAPFRKILPPRKTGGLDLSPAIVLVILYFTHDFLVPTLFDLANRYH
jgi:YggT family protein